MALRFDSGPLETYGSAEATGAGITVPDVDLLFTGGYARSGNNLNLTGDDDSSFVVIDYFSSDNPPSLSAPNGAMIDGETVSLLAGPQFPGQYAQAAVPPGAAVPQATQPAAIGKIGKLEGSATIQSSNGVIHDAKVGDSVFEKDIIQTGQETTLGIGFEDGTALSLKAESRVVLNKFVYQSDGDSNAAVFNILQGTFGLVAGQVAHTSEMKVVTPVATMGIRGTTVLGVEVDGPNGRVSTTNNFDGSVSPVWFYSGGQLIVVLQVQFSQISLLQNGLAVVTEKNAQQLELDSQLTKLVLEMAELFQVPQADDGTGKQPLSAHPSFEDGLPPGLIEINGPDMPLLPLTDFTPLLVLFVDPDNEDFQNLLCGANNHENCDQPDSQTNPLSAGLIGLAGLEEMDIGGEGGATESSVLPFNFGPAGPGIVDFSSLHNMQVLDSDGIPVTSMGMTITYVWDAGTNILTAVTEDGTPVFTVTVNPFTGAFTFILLKAIDHIGIGNDDDLVVKLTFTVTDDLGAIVQGKLLVALGDDVPTASVTSVVVDEDGLPTGNKDSAAGDAVATMASASGTFDVDFGADGPDATSELVVTLTSAGTADPNVGPIALTSNGVPVTTAWDDTTNTLTGSAGETPVFTLVVNDDGTYDFTLLANLDHPSTDSDGNNDGNPEMGYEDDIVLNFTATAKDGDGDMVQTMFTVTVDDDMPADFSPDHGFVINKNNSMAILDLEFAEAVGADQPEKVVFSVQDGSVATENGNSLTFKGDLIYVFGDGTSTLVGTTDPDFKVENIDPVKDDSIIFTISLDVANDTYKVTVYQSEISNGVGFSETDITEGVGGGNADSIVIGLNNNDGSVDILLDSPDGSINASNGRIGIGGEGQGGASQWIDDNQTVIIDFLINVDETDNMLLGEIDLGEGLFADSRFATTSFEQVVNRVHGNGTSSLSVAAIFGIPGGGDDPNITRVVITDENGLVVYDSNITTPGPAELVTSISGNTATMEDIEQDWKYFIETDGDMTGVRVSGNDTDSNTDINDGDARFTLGEFSLGGESFEPFTFDAPIAGTDWDDDSATSTINVTFLPADGQNNLVGTEINDNNPDQTAANHQLIGDGEDNIIAGLGGNDILIGLAGDDTLYGGNDDDTLDGGADNDTLIGGMGMDTFVIANLDAIDIIADYNFMEGDDIDLTSLFTTDLLNMTTPTTDDDTLGDFVQIVDNGDGNSRLELDADGDGDSFTQIATLTGVITADTVTITFNDDDGGTTSSNIVV